MPDRQPVSSLVLAELYDSADASFLDLLLKHQGNFKPLLGLIEKWKKDQRPFARKLKIEYALDGLPSGGACVIFKRLFKQAWHDRDHELMAAFMVTLDRSARRQRSKRYRFEAGIIESIETLRLPPRSTGGFSTATRHYLRRRAWRYFRKLGFADATSYLSGIVHALVRYTDDDVRQGENLLDNWGLMHACFGKSPQITFNPRHTNLATDGRLGAMEASPMFERHWQTDAGFAALLDILLRAECRPVRVWAIQLLRRLHADKLPRLDTTTLLKLIDHADPDVATFAADLLTSAQTVAAFPMATWMGLLATKNPAVVVRIVEAFRKHVSFDRVTLDQSVELATRAAAPVASLGLEILEARPVRSDADRALIAGLDRAQCAAVGERVAAFAMQHLDRAGAYDVNVIIAFFDSRIQTLRIGAFAALRNGSPADVDPAFWARLFESPYDDVRLAMIERLRSRTIPSASTESVASLWQGVLLNIHRGGRAKLSALRQISDRIVAEPASLKVLLPVVVIAIRSVRPPEARHGLAAIVTAVDRHPELAPDVSRALPELQLDVAGAPA